MKKISWDTEAARAMYDAGKSDREIAEALGISRNTVYHWRFIQNLPPNTRKAGRPKETEPKASPPRPLALPVAKGPMELSVKMDVRAFALRAPDLEGAAWIHEYAGQLLKDVGRIAAKLKEGTDDA